MAFVDTRFLSLGGVFKPFHNAAGMEDFEENSPYVLSSNEALLYQVRREKPDLKIKTQSEAEIFLKSIEPNRATAMQRQADNMFGTARLLAEGSSFESAEDKKTVAHTISTSKYRGVYFANPNLTAVELKRKVEMDEREKIFSENKKKRDPEMETKRIQLSDLTAAFIIGEGLILASACTLPFAGALGIAATPLFLGLFITGVAVVALISFGNCLSIKGARKEIPNVLADFGGWVKSLVA